MKRFHLFTLACFAIATLFYALSWMPGAIGLGILGAVFEIVGWVNLFFGDQKTRNDAQPTADPSAGFARVRDDKAQWRCLRDARCGCCGPMWA